MKKIILTLLVCVCMSVGVQAQKTVKIGKLSKKFEKKFDFMDIASWNTMQKKDTYIPYFTEQYYEATPKEVMCYQLDYPNNTTFKLATIDKMNYTDNMLSGVYLTKIPFELFDMEDFSFEIEKKENKDWMPLYEKNKDAGGKKIMEKYKKPYFRIFYKLKEDKQISLTEYSSFNEEQIEMKEAKSGSFMFLDEARAKDFLKILVAGTKK